MMAEITGLSRFIMLWTISPASCILLATTSELPMACSIISKSPPAEKAFPAPVMTVTRTSGSRPRSSQMRLNSLCSRKLVALSTSGRFIVTRATPSCFSTRR